MNYLAILVCGIASMVVGFLWYGPLFGKAYMEIMGEKTMTPEEKQAMKKSMGAMYFLQFVLALITAGALSYVFSNWADFTSSFVGIAFCLWFGFVMTTTAGSALWSGKSKRLAWRLFLISSSAQLVTFVVYAMILGGWQ